MKFYLKILILIKTNLVFEDYLIGMLEENVYENIEVYSFLVGH